LATALSEQDFLQLEVLVHQVEHMKYAGTETAGNLLGSNLLWKILERAGNDQYGGTFFLYSAHVPTLLGFLSTLQAAESFVAVTGGDLFVEYGGALIVEVYQETADGDVAGPLFLQLKFLQTVQSLQDEAFLIRLNSCGEDTQDDSTGYCNLSNFKKWAVENTLVDTEHWCEACGNDYSDVCLRAIHATDEQQQGDDSSGSDGSALEATTTTSTDHQNAALDLTATFFGGFLAGILLMTLVGYLCGFSTKNRNHNPTTVPTKEKNASTVSVGADATPSRGTNDIVVAKGDKNNETPSEIGSTVSVV
jgi:hypothetical protein